MFLKNKNINFKIRRSKVTDFSALNTLLLCVCVCLSFLLFMFRVCHAFLSIHCSLVVTCLERASLLALLCVMFYCVLSLSRVVFLGQMRYLIVSLSDLCLLTYFEIIHFVKTNLRKKSGILCVFCSSRWYLGNQSYFDAEKNSH